MERPRLECEGLTGGSSVAISVTAELRAPVALVRSGPVVARPKSVRDHESRKAAWLVPPRHRQPESYSFTAQIFGEGTASRCGMKSVPYECIYAYIIDVYIYISIYIYIHAYVRAAAKRAERVQPLPPITKSRAGRTCLAVPSQGLQLDATWLSGMTDQTRG